MYLGKIGDGEELAGHGLIHAVLAFLEDQRLDPTPLNYSFAYHVVSEPAGALALEVARRTDGGIRLTTNEVEQLGNAIDGTADVAGTRPEAAPGPPAAPPTPEPDMAAAEALVTETLRQVAGFADMVSEMRTETRDFGRNLAASADALQRYAPIDSTDAAVAELARITAAMRARVEIAEARLEQATQEASELREQLAAAHDDARRDPLTELPNRRAFEEAVAAVASGPVHIAMCDVDHFKAINDLHGHPVGDRVLRAIGTTLARECPDHLVARYGGEEFVVLIAGADVVEAETLIERARIAIGQRRYRLRESDTFINGISLSAGMVTMTPGETLLSAIERVDALLYDAKRRGRNCFVGERGG
ncbi:GGDEF domain-containing protein [uncultured Sphingomonas sp.]|uniref:GGDEF domain-containing protein n=1 Tax=uncultured Sphingomonas sp. TaxID=158754 RepID=UPI00258CC9E1|nr:GGDEF domain-containing protein [uncultured Sphingomonas sp.]